MKYIKSSFGYVFKNFLYIFLFALIPTAFIGGLISPFKTFEFITNYSHLSIGGFGDMFYALIDFKIVPIILTLLAIMILSIFVSLTIGQMENHMRSGKRNFNNMAQYLNNNILVVFVNFALLLLIWFVLQFLLVAILLLCHIVFSGIGNEPTVANIVFATIFCAVKFALFLQISLVMFLAIPNMLISGYPMKQAFSSSIKLLGKNNAQMLLSVFVPFVIIIPLALLLKGNLSYITNVIGTLILFIYYTALSMTAYFELSGISRYDNRKYYNYNARENGD